MILYSATEVVDVVTSLFVTGYSGTSLATVAAFAGLALFNTVHDVHEGTVECLIDIIGPQGTVEMNPDANVYVQETGGTICIPVSDSATKNTSSLVLQGASRL